MRQMLLVLFSLALVACANLDDVRQYADASGTLSNYSVLTTRFRDTYQREQPYLTGAADGIARENDERRAQAYRELLHIHRVVTLYMRTLAKMAGERSYDLGPASGHITEAIAALPDMGVTTRHADAYGKLAAYVAAALTGNYQQRQIRQMVGDCDADLQTLLAAMSTLTDLYKKTNDNERKTVLGMFEVELAFAKAPKDRLLAALAREQLQAKTLEYRAVQRKYAELERGLTAVALGHKALLDNIEQLDSSATRAVVHDFAQQIKASTDILLAIEQLETGGAP